MLNVKVENIPINSIRITPSEGSFSPRRSSRHLLSFSDNSVQELVYYRDGSVGIPFTWESVPGTPKIRSIESHPPPLTLPPSLHSRPVSRKPPKKRLNCLLSPSALLPKLKKPTGLQKSASSSSSAPLMGSNKQRKGSRSRLSFGSEAEDQDDPFDEDERDAMTRSQGCFSYIFNLFR